MQRGVAGLKNALREAPGVQSVQVSIKLVVKCNEIREEMDGTISLFLFPDDRFQQQIITVPAKDIIGVP